MTILICIAVLFLLYCLCVRQPQLYRQPQPFYPTEQYTNKPSNLGFWICLGVFAFIAYSLLEKKETKENTPPINAEPEAIIQPQNEATPGPEKAFGQPTPPIPLWMQPPPGVTPPILTNPFGRSPFDPSPPPSP